MEILNFQEAKMLNYWNGIRCGTVIRNYKLDEFGERINTILPEFIDNGLLRISSGKENVSRENIPKLKELLKQQGLSAAGKKSELVKRVCDNFSEQELNSYFTEAVYILTEKGQKAIDSFELFFLNDEFNCDFMSEELKTAKESYLNEEPLEILQKMLLRRFNKQFAAKDSKIEITCHNIIRILKRKNDYQNMLLFLWVATYNEMCGCSHRTDTYYVYLVRFPLREPTYINDFDLCKSALGWTLEEFCDFIRERAFSRAMEMPFSFFHNEELLKVVCDRLSGNEKPITPENYDLALPIKNHPEYDYFGE
ncbi:MAG: SAP domain-containing protein [Bacteroides sp.]|nr:SAP domain-containing protein [Eubacterium sp.]MCM1419730.1 SAP domain-containing protein [Roseburia sp.]MCM1463705.1 SAP domain-containing protein [Bacteroides sp.]